MKNCIDSRVSRALEKLARHEISIGKAAEFAGLHVGEMIELASKKKIDWIGYSRKDLRRDLKVLKCSSIS